MKKKEIALLATIGALSIGVTLTIVLTPSPLDKKLEENSKIIQQNLENVTSFKEAMDNTTPDFEIDTSEIDAQIEELEAELNEAIENLATPYDLLTEDERNLIAATAWTEDNLSDEGLEAVVHVIKNRLEDGRFGGAISDICVSNQFYGLNVWDGETLPDRAYKAVEKVWNGSEDITNGAVFFCTPSTDPNLIKTGLIETARVGGHVFFTDLPSDR